MANTNKGPFTFGNAASSEPPAQQFGSSIPGTAKPAFGGAATSGASLFGGSTSGTSSGAGLFGGSASNTNTATTSSGGSLFGGGAATSGGFKFNTTTQSTTPASSGPSLFGGASSTAGSTPSLFGAKPATGGLFGAKTSTITPSPLSGPATTPGTSTPPANMVDPKSVLNQPMPTGGLFQNLKNSTPQSTAPFGTFTPAGQPPNTAPPTGPSLFGSAQPPAAGGSGLFGTKPSENKLPAFGTTSDGKSLFGEVTRADTSASTTAQTQPSAASAGGLFSNFGKKPEDKPASSPFSGFAQKADSATPATGLFGGAAQPATTSASTGGLFGAKNTTITTTPASGGLFGAASASTTAPSSGGLFGAAQASTPAASSAGLFGGATTSTSAPSGGLFGGATTTTAPPSGGLFGAKSTTTTTAPAGGLFGAAPSSAQPAASTSGGLFGAASSSAQPAASTSGGLFGGTQASSQPAAPATSSAPSGLFGGASTSAQPAVTTTNAAPSASLFGASTGNAPGTSTQAQPSSRLASKSLDDIITTWSTSLAAHQKTFATVAERVSKWDRQLVQNSSTIGKLYTRVFQAERDTSEVERQLSAVEGGQRELEARLAKYEADVDQLLEAAGLGDEGVANGVDAEREETYHAAQDCQVRLTDMGHNLTSMIQEINVASSTLSSTKKADAAEDPLAQIVRVLNSHLAQLQAIDKGAQALTIKVEQAQKDVGIAAGRNGVNGGREWVEGFGRSYLGRR